MTTEVITKKYSIKDFMSLPDDGNRYELVKGELVEMPPAGEEHGSIGITLSSELRYFVKANQLGRVYGADTGFIIDPELGTVRAPDVAFVKTERIVRTKEAIPHPPDLAVEVISPSDRLIEVEDKVAEYLEAGVALIWVINPRRKEVYVYRVNSNQRTKLTLEDTLDGEKIIPGFSLAIKDLFE
jgi:Uma2 family endonuclease